MNTKKQLMSCIVKFLKNDAIGMDEEEAEGLEVATQCLETAYGLGESDECGVDLLTIFNEAIQKKQPSEVDKEKAEQLKNEGNELVKAGQFSEAVNSYTQAINHDQNNAVYFCNRAAAFTKLGENQKAIEDCEKAIRIDSSYGKAYGRMGLVYLNQKNYKKAEECYERAVSLEPGNPAYKSNLDLSREQQSQEQQSQPQNAPANPLAGLDLSSLLNNPAVMNMAQSFMQNPQMQTMFGNMMGGAPPPSGRVTSESPQESTPGADATNDPGSTNPTPGGGIQMPPGMDFGNIMNATQQFAEQMRQENPDLVENLRSQFQQGPQPDIPPQDNDKKDGAS